LADSRRITGPHLLLPVPGAVVELTDEDPAAVCALARLGAERLGWTVQTAIRRHARGATVAISAPEDQLYTACYLLDWAVSENGDWSEVAESQVDERNPKLAALLATTIGPVFADDDTGFTAGLGRHSRTWPLEALPTEAELGRPEGIPFVFLTGTNGKTTTTRMLAKIALAAGYTPGWTSSDAWGVADAIVETGDWTGPGAARNVLRHPDVDFGCLETARGGLLRRGLVIGGADAAVVTNVSSDHLGEWGVHDVADMAQAKLGVCAGIRQGGTLVVNAGNRWLREAVPEALLTRPDLVVAWFADGPVAGVELAATADAAHLVFGDEHVPLDEVPMSFGGTARHNVENALAAGLAAIATGISVAQVALGLGQMHASVAESRGRMNRFSLPNGATVLVDFAHNPDGVRQVGRATANWPADRRTLLVGQAGDRTNQDLVELAAVIAELSPDQVVLKQMHRYLRGREPGEVVGLMRTALREGGYPIEQISIAADELSAVEQLLDTAQPDDLLLLLIQADLDGALKALGQRKATPG
jgi:UDP-N-acetylmuramyl tripeptide synthase